jgi:hypothetical protein
MYVCTFVVMGVGLCISCSYEKSEMGLKALQYQRLYVKGKEKIYPYIKCRVLKEFFLAIVVNL